MNENPYESPEHSAEELDYYDALPSEAKNWAVLCHLAGLLGVPIPLAGHIVGPLAVWLLKRDDHPFVDDQGKEAVNFQISMAIYELIAALLICAVVGIVLLPALIVLDVVLVIVAAVKASNGEAYRYPMTFRLIN
ncbi:MAG: DUF4870 domain-containing protein [Pirellulales bacterium]